MDLELKIRDEIHRVSVGWQDDVCTVRHKGNEWEVEFSPISDGLFRFRIGNQIQSFK